jgi:BirA family biotin operon repressor/biotin-[acetyl-CoA-carboxylase] ligase
VPDGTPTRFTDIRRFAEIDSTNRYLLDEARAGAPEGVVAVADAQTAGRGRLGRSWVAPPGASLLVSVLLRPSLPPERAHLVTLACGLAAVATARSLAGADAQLKWPNDVVVADLKLAGILAERAGDAIVVGMGLNVHWDEFPPDIAATATALNLVGRAVSPDEVLEVWLREYDARLNALDRVLAEAVTCSATLGRRVRVELPAEAFEGVATRLTDDGHLLVARDGAGEVEVAAGDVIHLRPA